MIKKSVYDYSLEEIEEEIEKKPADQCQWFNNMWYFDGKFHDLQEKYKKIFSKI